MMPSGGTGSLGYHDFDLLQQEKAWLAKNRATLKAISAWPKKKIARAYLEQFEHCQDLLKEIETLEENLKNALKALGRDK